MPLPEWFSADYAAARSARTVDQNDQKLHRTILHQPQSTPGAFGICHETQDSGRDNEVGGMIGRGMQHGARISSASIRALASAPTLHNAR